MANAVLRLPVVIERVSLSRTTIYSRIKEGTFPKPIHLGIRAVGWLESDINEWIEQRINESHGGNDR